MQIALKHLIGINNTEKVSVIQPERGPVINYQIFFAYLTAAASRLIEALIVALKPPNFVLQQRHAQMCRTILRKAKFVSCLLGGPSIVTLENEIDRLKDLNTVFVSINNKKAIEQNILSVIGQKSRIWFLCDSHIESLLDEVVKFLHDGSTLALFTTAYGRLRLNQLCQDKISPVDYKIFETDGVKNLLQRVQTPDMFRHDPNAVFLNSLLVCLTALPFYFDPQIPVILFGCDGSLSASDTITYYKKSQMEFANRTKDCISIHYDTLYFIERFFSIRDAMQRIYGIKMLTALNTNMLSAYTVFQKCPLTEYLSSVEID